MVLSLSASAAPRSATLVWIEGDRAYLAARDSGAWAIGERVAVLRGADTAAVGEITGVLDGHLAAMRVMRGAIDASRPLAEWHVVMAPAVLAAPRLLRIGLPSHARGNLLLACAQVSLDTAFASHGYRTERLSAHAFRAVRDSLARDGAPWPDTLLLRLHPDATDQAIALERGEIDVAVYWPGECPPRLRRHATWGDALVGLRSRGVLAAQPPPGIRAGALPGDDAPLRATIEDVFAGDLQAIESPRLAPADTVAPRYLADPALPGHRDLQRLLDRHAVASRRSPWRLVVIDAPDETSDSLAPSGAPVPLARLGCTIVCAPEHRALVQALGPSVFADAIDCRRGERWR